MLFMQVFWQADRWTVCWISVGLSMFSLNGNARNHPKMNTFIILVWERKCGTAMRFIGIGGASTTGRWDGWMAAWMSCVRDVRIYRKLRTCWGNRGVICPKGQTRRQIQFVHKISQERFIVYTGR